MNQKKCPKCGELNPPEAVMCWACYTPLTGGAAAAAAGPVAGGKAIAAATEEEVKKSAASPAQMGIIGVALLVGVLYGGYALFGGGSTTAAYNPPGSVPSPGEFEGAGQSAPSQTPVSSSSDVPPPPTNTAFNNPGLPTPDIAFSMVASPSPNFSRGTMGILAQNPNLNPAQAVDLARRANQLSANRWKPLTIYVFSDKTAAQLFKDYQSQHNNRPLSGDDYQNLSGVWSRTVLYYQYSGGREILKNPSSNSTGWWTQMNKHT